jgi:hypothetical protein
LKDENELLRKQISENLAAHSSMVKAVEETAATEIESLKRALAEKEELLRVCAEQAEEVQRKHERATVAMRVELEKLTEEAWLIDEELTSKLCFMRGCLTFSSASSF